MRWKSRKLVNSSGGGGVLPASSGLATGPRRVGPTKPVVLVLTPSMDLARKLVSSTNTPGARYSGTGRASFSSSSRHRSRGDGHVETTCHLVTRSQIQLHVGWVRKGRERRFERRGVWI